MTREIPLTKGMVALVDDQDFDWLSQFKWRVNGQARNGIYAGANGPDGKYLAMHRLIADAPSGVEVDHINRNGLDNRRCNLRLCTRADNARNRSYSRKRPGYRGAYPKNGRWIARLSVDGRQITLGAFDLEIQAAMAYDAAAKRHFGEFAALNFGPDRDWLLPYSIEPRTRKAAA